MFNVLLIAVFSFANDTALCSDNVSRRTPLTNTCPCGNKKKSGSQKGDDDGYDDVVR